MNPILFFDTETTGLPLFGEPSDHPDQPHLVEIGAILADEDTREVYAEISLLIKPDSWEISEEVSKIHGITNEAASKFGVTEDLALILFWNLVRLHNVDDHKCIKRVAYNASFDQRMVRIALKRFNFDPLFAESWADKESLFCTMQASKPILGLKDAKGRPKNPKLSEAYQYFTGKELVGAHRAINDARACMEIYFAMQDLEKEAVHDFVV